MREKLSVSLPPEMVNAIKERVQSGSFASTSEVLRTAVRHWLKDEEEHEAWLAEVRARIDASINDPRPPITDQEMQAYIDQLYREHQNSDA